LQQPALENAKIRARRWMAPGAMLAVAAALAGCGADNSTGGANSSAAASSPGANGPSAATGALPALAPAAPACPKLAAPQCPPATAPTRLSEAPAVQPRRHGAHMAAAWPGGSRGSWSRDRVHRHDIARERRDWDLGRPWPGDRPDARRWDHHGQGLTQGDRWASERDGLMGGPAVERRGGYRSFEESRETERSSSFHAFGGERVIERYRENGPRPCPLDCKEGWTGDWRGGYRAAGVDPRGYLIWPGKVEY
jgi:hypothetical protein